MSEEYRKLWHDRIDGFNMAGDKDYISYEYVGTSIMATLVKLIQSGQLATKLKAKFDKGMAEHGMGFDKVDFDTEIENEILDICNYLIGKHYSKNDGEVK